MASAGEGAQHVPTGLTTVRSRVRPLFVVVTRAGSRLPAPGVGQRRSQPGRWRGLHPGVAGLATTTKLPQPERARSSAVMAQSRAPIRFPARTPLPPARKPLRQARGKAGAIGRLVTKLGGMRSEQRPARRLCLRAVYVGMGPLAIGLVGPFSGAPSTRRAGGFKLGDMTTGAALPVPQLR